LPGEGPGTDLLTSRIDIDNVVALNVEGGDGAVKRIFKPWDERYDEEKVHFEPGRDARQLMKPLRGLTIDI
jgi:hypothetical protein